MVTTLLLSVAVAIVLEIAAVFALVWRYCRRRVKASQYLYGRQAPDIWLGGASVGTWAVGGASGLWASGAGSETFNFGSGDHSSSGDYGSCGDGAGDSGGSSGGD